MSEFPPTDNQNPQLFSIQESKDPNTAESQFKYGLALTFCAKAKWSLDTQDSNMEEYLNSRLMYWYGKKDKIALDQDTKELMKDLQFQSDVIFSIMHIINNYIPDGIVLSKEASEIVDEVTDISLESIQYCHNQMCEDAQTHLPHRFYARINSYKIR